MACFQLPQASTPLTGSVEVSALAGTILSTNACWLHGVALTWPKNNCCGIFDRSNDGRTDALPHLASPHPTPPALPQKTHKRALQASRACVPRPLVQAKANQLPKSQHLQTGSLSTWRGFVKSTSKTKSGKKREELTRNHLVTSKGAQGWPSLATASAWVRCKGSKRSI